MKKEKTKQFSTIERINEKRRDGSTPITYKLLCIYLTKDELDVLGNMLIKDGNDELLVTEHIGRAKNGFNISWPENGEVKDTNIQRHLEKTLMPLKKKY